MHVQLLYGFSLVTGRTSSILTVATIMHTNSLLEHQGQPEVTVGKQRPPDCSDSHFPRKFRCRNWCYSSNCSRKTFGSKWHIFCTSWMLFPSPDQQCPGPKIFKNNDSNQGQSFNGYLLSQQTNGLPRKRASILSC